MSWFRGGRLARFVACFTAASSAGQGLNVAKPIPNCSKLQYYPGYLPEDESLIRQFATETAMVNEAWIIDGFGVKTLRECVPFADSSEFNKSALQFPLPDDGFHAEGIEYVALLDAVSNFAPSGRFCMAELGAGWGPWLAMAGVITRRMGVQEVHLVGVEASKARFELMQRHMAVNGLLGGSGLTCRLEQAAIWHTGEMVSFPVDDLEDLGAAATPLTMAVGSQDYRGRQTEFECVPAMTLQQLFAESETCDFLHIDVQGVEFELLASSSKWWSENVKAILVATHSRELEGKIIRLFSDEGWLLRREKPCRFTNERLQGGSVSATYCDGAQYWVHPSVANRIG